MSFYESMKEIKTKLFRYMPVTRGRLLDMEEDMITFIDMSQEQELIIRNDLRHVFIALVQHIKETSGIQPKKKDKNKKDKKIDTMFG